MRKYLFLICFCLLSACTSVNKPPSQEHARLGIEYYEKQDYKNAILHLRRGAENGDSECQYLLGLMYENGQGVSQSYEQAVIWYSKASDQEHDQATYNIAMMYHLGKGVALDESKAFELFSILAKKGNYSSQVNVAHMYWFGQGIPENRSMAYEWLYLVASHGDAEALYRLHVDGSIPQDTTECFQLYSKAADEGNGHAQICLAFMYSQGRGVGQNYAQAYKWFYIAKMIGYANAQETLEQVIPQMSEDDLAQGKRLAEEYLELHPLKLLVPKDPH